VNFQGQSHSLYHLEYFLLGLDILRHLTSQLTPKLFELVSSRRTCSLVFDIRIPHNLNRSEGPKYRQFSEPCLERVSIIVSHG
jgi:hypothetical protein